MHRRIFLRIFFRKITNIFSLILVDKRKIKITIDNRECREGRAKVSQWDGQQVRNTPVNVTYVNVIANIDHGYYHIAICKLPLVHRSLVINTISHLLSPLPIFKSSFIFPFLFFFSLVFFFSFVNSTSLIPTRMMGKLNCTT